MSHSTTAGQWPFLRTVQATLDADTTTTLSVPPTATTGVSVDLTATVSPAPTGGAVQFLDAGAPIGAPVDVTAGGTAILSHAFATAGSHTITASFSGAPGFVASAALEATVVVSDPVPVATTTTLTVPETVRPADGAAMFVVVNPARSGNGGTVQFFDGTIPIGNPVPVTNGRASITFYNFTAGPHSVTAKYSGTIGYLASTSEAKVVTVTVSEPDPEAPAPVFGSS